MIDFGHYDNKVRYLLIENGYIRSEKNGGRNLSCILYINFIFHYIRIICVRLISLFVY